MKEFIFYCGDDFIKTAKSIHNRLNLVTADTAHKVAFKMAGEQNFATRYSGKINTTAVTAPDKTGLHTVVVSGMSKL